MHLRSFSGNKDLSSSAHKKSITSTIVAGVVAGAILVLAVILAPYLYFSFLSNSSKNGKFSQPVSIFSSACAYARWRERARSYFCETGSLQGQINILELPVCAWVAAGLFDKDYRNLQARLRKEGVRVQPFSLARVRRATKNFRDKIGEGGFGPVYRGVLEDGQEVAVKVLSGTSKQGKQEFYNEVCEEDVDRPWKVEKLPCRLCPAKAVDFAGLCYGLKLGVLFRLNFCPS